MRPLLFAALCVLPGCLLPTGGGTDTNVDDTGTSTGETTNDPTTAGPSDDTSTSDTPSTSTGPDDTTGPGESCGDGVKTGAEECDDGNPDNTDDCLDTCKTAICGDGFVQAGAEECDDDNADDTDACLATCKAATCGDNEVWDGHEVCDDAVNDGSYGGCVSDCTAMGPFCGDGILDANDGEECDDPDAGGCLSSCKVAKSCSLLHDAEPGLPSGMQTIYPTTPDAPVDVFCDMVSDNGGYTFLKLDIDSETNDLPYPASKAETECEKYGMNLWIPRSPDHLLSGYMIATTENLPPLGGGTKLAAADYMQILGVYPETENVSCAGMALTQTDCPQWIASDSNAWYVSDVVKNMLEPDPDLSCAGCSMIYTWNIDGTVKTYKTLPGGGTSFRFFCDVGDKQP